MTSKRRSKADVCLAPKATTPRESGEALSLCDCPKVADKAECSTCAKHQGRSVRCQHCPMVFLSVDHLARHLSSSHNERHSTSSSRESANTKAAEPENRPKRRVSEKSAPVASAPKTKIRKVEATVEPPVVTNDCATRTRVSSFRCPECPKAYQSARSLKRHSAIHQRLAVFEDKKSEDGDQNGQLAADLMPKSDTTGKPKSDSSEPNPSISSSTMTTSAAVSAATTLSSPKPESSSIEEQPVQESKTEKKTPCRSNRRSTKTDGPPPPLLPMDTIVCSECQETYEDESTFAEHQQLKHGGAYPAACDICQLQFPSPTLLRAHKIANHRSRRGRPTDEKDPFSRWYVFADEQKHLKCDQCNYNSLWYHKGRFLEHYRIHTGERPYTCDLCGKQFRTRTLMHKHVTFVHEGVKEHACDLCGRRFSDKRYMEDHRRIHTGERPYVCDLCGKTFKQSASLFIHKELHKGLRKHACDLCGKRFTTRSSLNIHIKRHVGERNFVCAICGKAFVDGKHLRDHSTVHSDERPFGCELCGARFKLMKHLKQHGRTHKRDFPG